LTRKNIDTGAGLERLASISQDVPTDFDTDAFLPSIKILESMSPFKYHIDAYFTRDLKQLQINHDFKVIVDHIKANVFAIADGALPSNKERGSVLRKLTRRALVCCRRLKISNFIEPLVNEIINTNKHYYPYLIEQKDTILSILQKEVTSFLQTLEHGYELFKGIVKQKDFGTESIFKLVDTYGLPFEVINELASEYKISINEEAYLQRLDQHRDISRSDTETHGMDKQNSALITFNSKSEFDYERLLIKNAKIIACFNADFTLTNNFKSKGWIVCDKTPFYATSGGQQHDIGTIRINGHSLDVLDVIKAPNGQHLHLVKTDIIIKTGDKIDLLVNEQNRISLARNHSVEHLIQRALQTIISKTIKQEGAFKSAEKVSFDFQYANKLTDKQLEHVEDQINKYIKLAVDIKTHHMTLDEAKKFGAIA
jgi:alanyl-tRNA synthetase